MTDKHFLEENPSIFENNLLLEKDDPIAKLMQGRESKKEDDIPWKLVKPTPGFCAKTHTLEGDKIFMNICYTDDIPEPEDLTDAELIAILESEEASSFRVPMSIGSLHVEADKSGNLCSAYDIAINSNFFNKIYTNELFKTFFLTVVMEGLQEKYSLELTLQDPKPYHIVKNRKCLGNLQMHRIQQRPVRKPPKPLIQEITSPTANYKAIEPKIVDLSKPSKPISDKMSDSENQKLKTKQSSSEAEKKTNKTEVLEIASSKNVPKIVELLNLTNDTESQDENEPKINLEPKVLPAKKPLIMEISDSSASPEETNTTKKPLTNKITNTESPKIIESKTIFKPNMEKTNKNEINKLKITEIPNLKQSNKSHIVVTVQSETKELIAQTVDEKIGDYFDTIPKSLENNKIEFDNSPKAHMVKHPMAGDDVKRVRLFGVPNNESPEKIVAFIKFPALSGADINLDVAEESVAISNKKNEDSIDFSLPVKINSQQVVANYCVNLQVLKLIFPVKQAEE